MKPIASLVGIALLLGACGGVKNTNPLLGLAGPADGAPFAFEGSAQGWAAETADTTVVDLVQGTSLVSLYGAGSLGLHVSGMSATGFARASVVLAAATDFSGRRIKAFVYLPSEAAPNDSLPSGGQLYAYSGGSIYANGPYTNLARGGWTELSMSPIPNPSTSTAIDDGRGYYGAGFDPAAVTKLGVKIAAAGAATGFSYTGSLYLDSVRW